MLGDLTVSVPTVSMRTVFYGNIRDIDSFLVSRAGLATILLTTRQPDKILYGFFDMLENENNLPFGVKFYFLHNTVFRGY